jgi:putative RecB family exonuclease
MHTSYSALNTFLTCPLKYKFQVIDRIKTPQKPEQAFGSLVHRALKFARTPSSKGYPDKEETINYFSQNWNQEAFQKEETQRGFFEDGIRILNAQLEKLTDEDRKKTIALEHRFIVKVGEHTLGGAIDRIDRTDQGFEIIDYKTNRKIPPQKEIDGDLQLSIYLRAFIKEWPSLFTPLHDTAKIKLSLEFLRHGLRMSTTRTQDDLQKIDQDILAIIDQVAAAEQTQSFEPKISALCDWCDFQNICPMFRHKFRDTKQKLSEKDIQTLGEKFIRLKGQEKDLRKEITALGVQLNDYLSQANLGQFFAENGSVLRQLRETHKYDPVEIAEIFKKWQKDPLAVMKVDAAALNKFSSNLSPEQKRDLARLKKLDRQNYYLTVKGKKD